MEWSLDGGRWERERSPGVTLTFRSLSEGQHVLSVRDSNRGRGGGGR